MKFWVINHIYINHILYTISDECTVKSQHNHVVSPHEVKARVVINNVKEAATEHFSRKHK